jgi:hypothetical protein
MKVRMGGLLLLSPQQEQEEAEETHKIEWMVWQWVVLEQTTQHPTLY